MFISTENPEVHRARVRPIIGRVAVARGGSGLGLEHLAEGFAVDLPHREKERGDHRADDEPDSAEKGEPAEGAEHDHEVRHLGVLADQDRRLVVGCEGLRPDSWTAGRPERCRLESVEARHRESPRLTLPSSRTRLLGDRS